MDQGEERASGVHDLGMGSHCSWRSRPGPGLGKKPPTSPTSKGNKIVSGSERCDEYVAY